MKNRFTTKSSEAICDLLRAFKYLELRLKNIKNLHGYILFLTW